jgi:FixJ family two-component response regulator
MIQAAEKSPRVRGSGAQALVSVVDDDESVRESLPGLLRQFGFASQAFASAEQFLKSECVATTRVDRPWVSN